MEVSRHASCESSESIAHKLLPPLTVHGSRKRKTRRESRMHTVKLTLTGISYRICKISSPSMGSTKPPVWTTRSSSTANMSRRRKRPRRNIEQKILCFEPWEMLVYSDATIQNIQCQHFCRQALPFSSSSIAFMASSRVVLLPKHSEPTRTLSLPAIVAISMSALIPMLSSSPPVSSSPDRSFS